MKNKSMEYWYGVVSMFLFTASIISRPELSAPDKILTIALISTIPWITCFISRKEKEKAGENNTQYTKQ